MTTDDTMTIAVTADDPVVKAMQEINRAFFSAAQRLGVPFALEGLANILIINLAAGYGERWQWQRSAISLEMRDQSLGCGAPSLSRPIMSRDMRDG